jgi:hypothetical protein
MNSHQYHTNTVAVWSEMAANLGAAGNEGTRGDGADAGRRRDGGA